MGILTPYATGPSPIWYGLGYIQSKTFWLLGAFFGIIDEARIWTTERSIDEMNACRNRSLEQSGTCGFNESGDNMILYVNFNECEGHSVTDRTGTFNGGLEYPFPVGSGHFEEWTTGWTEDTPF